MNEFADGFVKVWQSVLNSVFSNFPDWSEVGAAFAILTVGLAIILIFAFFCLYLPWKWDQRERKKREMNPNDPYYGRDTLESR
jgi:hypothetical protein